MLNPAQFPLMNPSHNTGMVESVIYLFAGNAFTVRDVKTVAPKVSSRLAKIGARQLHDTIHSVIRALIKEGRVRTLDYVNNHNVYQCTFKPTSKMELMEKFMLNHRRKHLGETVIHVHEDEFLEFLGSYSSSEQGQ